MTKKAPPSFFPSAALDHAAAGIGAGVVTTLCMNPLDMLKVRFQVSNVDPRGGPGKQIWYSLQDIYRERGVKGLYRGVSPNIAGNAASWGLYFWLYNILKTRASKHDPSYVLSAGQFLLCSAQASSITAIVTNPLWVVRVRIFTTNPDTPHSYRGLFHGLYKVSKTEGINGLFRGTSLALVGVGNGAIQFMAYEKMKTWGFDRQQRAYERDGIEWSSDTAKLSNTYYTLMSGASKLVALTATYPYQVVRSRIQNHSMTHLYPTIPTTIARTWKTEGVKGFYRGLGTNLVRILPGTSVTFVVYENLAWLFRTRAARRRGEEDD